MVHEWRLDEVGHRVREEVGGYVANHERTLGVLLIGPRVELRKERAEPAAPVPGEDRRCNT